MTSIALRFLFYRTGFTANDLRRTPSTCYRLGYYFVLVYRLYKPNCEEMSLELSSANAIVQRQWSNSREVSATGKPQGRSLSRLITRPLNVFFNSPFVAASVCTETPSRWGYTCYLLALSHLGLLSLFRKPQLCPSIASEPGEPVNENVTTYGAAFLFFDVQEAWKTSGTHLSKTAKTKEQLS